MKGLRCRVRTHCEKQAASTAALNLASGASGERTALPECRVLIHEPIFSGTVVTREQLEGYAKLEARVENLLARQTGQSVERVRTQQQREAWMDAAEAKAFGLIDEVGRSSAR